MRGSWRWAWAGGAIAVAGLAAGLAFAVIDGSGTEESDLPSTSPATASGSTPTLEPSAPAGSSGIEGEVVQSPICPVETDPPQPECAPRPYEATIIVWNADRSAQVTEFTAGEDGRFRVPLDAGDYEIEPQGEGRFPMPPPPFAVTVPPNEFVQLDIEYDTGIR